MGLSSFLHATLANEATKTYGTPQKTGGAIEVKPTVNYNDAPIYSDNRLKHKNTSFKDGSIALTIDYANKAVLSPLIGRNVVSENFVTSAGSTISVARHISNTGNKPIFVGFGYVVADHDVDGEKSVYTVKFFYKVQFQPYTQDAKTKKGTIEYLETTLTGTIYEMENGDWCEEEDFDSESVAVEYLYKLFGGSYASETRLAALNIGALTLTPAFDVNTIIYEADALTPTAVITAEAVSESAVIVIKNNGATVTNGGTATFTEGINQVTVTVTVGAASKTYTAYISYEA